MEQTDELFGEISCDEIQSMMDQILGQNTFSFSGYIDQILQGNLPFSVQDTLQTILRGFAANIAQEKKMYMYLVLIALLGAILGNFAGLMQGGQVAEVAFYAVYLLFFSVLLTAFTSIAQIAQATLESLFDFCACSGSLVLFSNGIFTGKCRDRSLLSVYIMYDCSCRLCFSEVCTSGNPYLFSVTGS